MGQALLWNKQSVKNYTLKFCSERFLLNQRVFYFPKDFYLVEEINHQISVLSSNGILSYLISRYVDTDMLNVKTFDAEPLPITFNQVSGIFYVYGVCLAAAVVVFIIEKAFQKWKTTKYFDFIV